MRVVCDGITNVAILGCINVDHSYNFISKSNKHLTLQFHLLKCIRHLTMTEILDMTLK